MYRGRHALRRGPGAAARRWLVRWLGLAAVAVVLFPVVVAPPYDNRPAIRSDGYGYHAWTRALVERDLTFCGDPQLGSIGAISHRDERRGVCANKYSPGLAIVRFPVMALLVDRRSDTPPVRDREDAASEFLAAGALLGICALLTDACRRLGVPGSRIHVALVTTVFGTGLFHYATYDGSFTHVWSALGFSALIWWAVRGSPPPAPLLGYTGFCLVGMRPTNALLLAILGAGWLLARREARRLVPLAVGSLAGLLVIVAYNRYALGSWTLSSYGDEPFLFDRPKQWPVLVSYERGLFTWYPVLAVVLAAGLASRAARRATALLALLLAGLAAVYGFWPSWYLGGGFGHRGFVELVPFATVAFALALPRRRVPFALVAGAAGAAMLVTTSLMQGYWRRSVPFAGTTGATYWSHVLGDDFALPGSG